ncbi:MAG: penicillin-binding protein 2 [Gammaproteobacteria bacterium RIFCSPHIGHO2_12_FULL_42_13]|nr:MAG: penicillin-binding protein 2 [Gammaproteobacteria bacterium RIFCSPHIGHO2_12_FULL_42_13]
MTPLPAVNVTAKRFNKRLRVCALIVFFLFSLLCARLIYLQVVVHHFYATLSKRNIISVVPVKATRGIIYDRNGVVLAQNIPVYSLMLTLGRVQDLKETIEGLKKIVHLTDEDIHTFYRILRQYYPYQPVLLKQSLTEQEVARFYVDQYRYPGVTIQTNMIRQYPLGSVTSEVVGYIGRITQRELNEVDPADYTTSDEIGKAGAEAEDEVLLHGKVGSQQAEIDANGKVVRILKMTPAIPGDHIYLSIDSKLQAVAKTAFGNDKGALVALDPESGQILALVSKPSYDPNIFETGMTHAQYQALMKSSDHPMFNRATHATYAPGSTIKPFISFGALNMGIISVNDYIDDPGWFRLPGTEHVFHNWVRTGFGSVNVIKALTVSCDTFFYALAATLGIHRLNQTISQFGFGEATGADLPNEHVGVLPTPEWKMKHIGAPWYTGDTVVAGIGQGYITATPLQLAASIATLSERGKKFRPQLLWKLTQPNGLVTTLQPIPLTPIAAKNPKDWETVIEALHQVVESPYGTAHRTFSGAKYSAAGKTGTAQINRSGDDPKNLTTLNDHLFICFAPVDHPKIAVAVVVERISGMTQSAVKIARQVMDYYFQELATGKIDTALPASNENTAVSDNIKKLLQDDFAQEMRLENSTMKNETGEHTEDNEASLEQALDTRINAQIEIPNSEASTEQPSTEYADTNFK